MTSDSWTVKNSPPRPPPRHLTEPIWPSWGCWDSLDFNNYIQDSRGGRGCRCHNEERFATYPWDRDWRSPSEDDFNVRDPFQHLTEHRYLRGRLPTADPNPRGKNHRRPLSWRRGKLQVVQGWEGDADEYRRYLWREGEEGGGKGGRTRPNKPHFLRYLEANRRRHRYVRYYCCYCCDRRVFQTMRGWRREWHGMVREEMEVMREGGGWFPGRSIPVWNRGPRVGSRLAADEILGVCKKERGMVEDALVLASEGDDYERGADFNLGDIAVTGPVYSVRYRSAKRKGKTRATTTNDGQKSRVDKIPGAECNEWFGCDGQLEWEFIDREHDGGWTCVSEVGSACGSEWIAVDTDADSSNTSAKDSR